MKKIVIYRSRYGGTKAYAQWIAEELGCQAIDGKKIKIDELADYDTIIYGGGLYAEVINGVDTLTKNFEKLSGKRIAVFTTGITPVDCRKYYDDLVLKRNFKEDMLDKIKVFNFPGKMIIDELSFVHRIAIKTLKKFMSGEENSTEQEKMLVDLCNIDGDFTDRNEIKYLIEYVNGL